jgi:spore coat polysaccharide biosynthesis protein SpsF (cytidylyltransferase family)
MHIPFLITARLSSVRLPRKLMQHLDGTEVVGKVIERAIAGFGMNDVVLCTSPLSMDDDLVTVSERYGIAVFRGHPEDILLRLCGALRERNSFGMVGQTGENPIFDVDDCLRIRDRIAAGKDLVRFLGLPIGCSPYGISRAALETLLSTKEEEDTGFWGYLLNKPDIFDVELIEAEENRRMPAMRLTTDYPEDLELMRAIFRELPGMPSVASVVSLLKDHPELRTINGMRVQADLDPETKTRLEAFFALRGKEVKKELELQRFRERS